ncbi:UbiD family decarboxylase [Chloroflexota bacterium]
MPFKDVREFIDKLEKDGEAIRIEDEVDWNLEAGAMVRRSSEEDLPAPFFQKVKGYPDGYRLFGAPGANYRRIAIAMDLKPETHPRDIMKAYLEGKKEPLEPKIVKDGPCKENVHTGDEVDLLEFPVPMIHESDGGRYIGTWHLTVSKDLDSDWVNWGMYRHMLQNKNTVGILLASESKHLWSMYSKGYQPRSKPMEVAIAIGTEPVSSLCAATYMKHGVSEGAIAGGIRREPVEMIKCETVDLLVPATSEIVIEGSIKPGDTMVEGPFGEAPGYMSGLQMPRPAIRVKAVTHRNNPILTMSCMGIPVDDNCILAVTKGAELLEILRARGLAVADVSIFPEGAYLVAAVSVKKTYAGVADDIAHTIWGTHIGPSIPYIIVVEDDVDPFNIKQVLHAIATKCHPYKSIYKLERGPANNLIPWLSRYERTYEIGGRVYFDCTWPLDWDPKDVPKRISFAEAYPPKIQQKALDMWRKYGY